MMTIGEKAEETVFSGIRAFVFDMDGVLFDTERMFVISCFQAAGELGLLLNDRAVYGRLGLNEDDGKKLIMDSMARLYPGGTFPYEEYSRRSHAHYMERLSRSLPVLPGAEELLKFLRGKNILTALASSSPRERVCSNLERSHLGGYFDQVVCGDMVKRSKPSPDVYLVACEALGVPCGETMAVEDSPNGIQAARDAGLRITMVPNLIEPTPEIRASVDFVSGSLTELRDHLSAIWDG